MTSMFSRAVALLLLSAPAGCRRGDVAPTGAAASVAPLAVSASAPPARAPVASSAPSASASPVTFGAPGPAVIVPAVPALEKGSMDHADAAGWSADDAKFGHCRHSGGLGGATCVVLPRAGASETFGDFDEKRSAVDPARHATLVARKKALAFSAAPRSWAFARDLELTWDSPAGDTLRVGARVRGEAPSFSIVLEDKNPGAREGSAHPEVVALSADGAWLGAMSHTFHGEYTDTFTAKVLPVVRVAAQAYNDAGYAHHKKRDYARAVELFAQAAAADPTFALAAYNLACAHAKLGDAPPEAALADALARAGADAAIVKKRARADDDFAAVRAEPWFVALTRE